MPQVQHQPTAQPSAAAWRQPAVNSLHAYTPSPPPPSLMESASAPSHAQLYGPSPVAHQQPWYSSRPTPAAAIQRPPTAAAFMAGGVGQAYTPSPSPPPPPLAESASAPSHAQLLAAVTGASPASRLAPIPTAAYAPAPAATQQPWFSSRPTLAVPPALAAFQRFADTTAPSYATPQVQQQPAVPSSLGAFQSYSGGPSYVAAPQLQQQPVQQPPAAAAAWRQPAVNSLHDAGRRQAAAALEQAAALRQTLGLVA